MTRYTLPAAMFAAMLLAGSLDASSSGLREREPTAGLLPVASPSASTRQASSRSLSSSRRVIGYGQIKFDGLGPEKWAAKWRKQRREHRRDVRWLRGELAKARPTRSLSSASPASTICAVFGAYCSQAIRVATCESTLNVNAQNGQYLGLFQLGSYARARYGHGPDAYTQSRAAYAYFVDSGKDWSPWECKP